MEPLFEWGLKFLPLIVTWFEHMHGCGMLPTTHRSELSAGKLSAVYKFIRGMPALTALSRWHKLDANAQTKRRRIDDEMRQLDSERSRSYHEEEEEAARISLGDRSRSEGSSAYLVSGSKRMRLVGKECLCGSPMRSIP